MNTKDKIMEDVINLRNHHRRAYQRSPEIVVKVNYRTFVDTLSQLNTYEMNLTPRPVDRSFPLHAAKVELDNSMQDHQTPDVYEITVKRRNV